MVPQPHDRLVKWAFARQQTAESCLRCMLPAALADSLDWRTLSAQPASFVDPDLADSHSDLLYAVRPHGSKGRALLLYLLFEHQSSPDRWMALRLASYTLQIQRRWLAGWGPVLAQVLREQGLEALHAMFRYFTEVSDQRPGPELRRWIASSLGPEAEDTMKSWAQQEREEGRLEG